MKLRLGILLLLFGLPALAAAEIQYVQVEKTRLLTKPSAFSSAAAKLAYRTRVEVLGRRGAYVRVKSAAGTGYVSASALSVKQPRFSSRLSKEYVSSDEVALATKGFNAQIESEYRRKNPALPYAILDRLEAKTTYSDPLQHFRAFRQTGKLGEFRTGGER